MTYTARNIRLRGAFAMKSVHMFPVLLLESWNFFGNFTSLLQVFERCRERHQQRLQGSNSFRGWSCKGIPQHRRCDFVLFISLPFFFDSAKVNSFQAKMNKAKKNPTAFPGVFSKMFVFFPCRKHFPRFPSCLVLFRDRPAFVFHSH